MKHPPKNIIVDWLNTIWLTDLPYQSKYLACYLRKFMNSQHDMAYPSYARIIHETGLSRMTVSRYLTVLEDEGWLVRDRGHKGKNTTYTVCFPSSITEVLVSERAATSITQSTTSIREVHELNNNKQVINNILVNPKGLKNLANVYLEKGEQLRFIKAMNSATSNQQPLDHMGTISDALERLSIKFDNQPLLAGDAIPYCKGALNNHRG